MSAYDTARLQELGRRRRKLDDQLKALDTELDPEILAAAQANVQQADMVQWTGYSRETVRRKSMTPEQLDAERARRRQKARS